MDKAKLIERTGQSELLKFLGVKIEVATAERVVLTMEVTPKVHQYVGIMNGGVSLYLCETAASIGVVAGADLTKVTPVGIEINAKPASRKPWCYHRRGKATAFRADDERLEY
jgi:uncharacterized protein (TIGR00369 family)